MVNEFIEWYVNYTGGIITRKELTFYLIIISIVAVSALLAWIDYKITNKYNEYKKTIDPKYEAIVKAVDELSFKELIKLRKITRAERTEYILRKAEGAWLSRI